MKDIVTLANCLLKDTAALEIISSYFYGLLETVLIVPASFAIYINFIEVLIERYPLVYDIDWFLESEIYSLLFYHT